MTPTQLSAIIACGEDSRHQFKRDFTNAESLAAELAAFANMGGGMLLVGVGDDGKVAGLASSDISRLNQLLSNAASQHVKPPINPTTTNVKTPQGLVMLIEVTAREEMQRIFQQAGLLHADEQAVSAANLDNIDQAEFAKYFERRYGKPIMATGMPLERLLPNLNLICKNKFQKSVSEIIETRKLIEAKTLLLHTNKSISEIGFELGYNEKSYFTRVFHAKMDITPSRFREMTQSIIS